MDKAAADCIEHQLRSAFPEGAITRVQVLRYGDDPEVEPGQTVIRVFFDPATPNMARVYDYWLGGKDNYPRTGPKLSGCWESTRRCGSWSGRTGRS
jgi:S-adenosyl methyltransferase